MATGYSEYETCQEHHRRIAQYMPVQKWKFIKGVLYSGMTIGFAVFAITMDAHPTWVFMGAGAMILVFYIGEAKELEMARWFSITFNGGRDGHERSVEEEDD